MAVNIRRFPAWVQMPKVRACTRSAHHDGAWDQAREREMADHGRWGCAAVSRAALALRAVGELGGSASISEIVETVIKREGFSDAQ
jgi:hypothetical protein